MTSSKPIDLNDPALRDERIEIAQSHDDEVPCAFVTGIAGSGKTYLLRERIKEDPSYGYLCATTGISAINLNTITLNSLLRYFDTDSLQNSYESGYLLKVLKDLAQRKRNLVVDEASMMSRDQLDILYQAVSDVNEYRTVGKPFGIVLTGDFCQLRPINEPFAFEADCWPAFERNTTKLTKNWRQGDGRFLDALNALRRGDGGAGVEILQSLGVEFADSGDANFDGTTIRATNKAVDRFNFLVHRKLKGRMVSVLSTRWGVNPNGKPPSEWRQIPEKLELKIGSYVMILANDTDSGEGEFSFANGDCGHVVDYDDLDETFEVKLVRNEETVQIGMIERKIVSRDEPNGFYPGKRPFKEGRNWVYGGISYFPLRLAYAATVHKTQGLSLDRIQVDCREGFFGQPSMAYVALSRARTAEGVRIVGTPQQFAKKVKVSPEVLRWL